MTESENTRVQSTRHADLPDPEFGLDELTTGVYQPFEERDPQLATNLLTDIAANGIRDEILTDQDGAVIDGNTRVALAQELPTLDEYPQIESIEDIPYRIEILETELTDTGKRERAVAENLTRRQVDERDKKSSIRGFITRLDADSVERSDGAIADLYGVSRQYVGQIRRTLADEGKIETGFFLPKAEIRQRVRESILRNPDATDQEIADRVGVETTRRTVSNVRADISDPDPHPDEQTDGEQEAESEPKNTPEPTTETEASAEVETDSRDPRQRSPSRGSVSTAGGSGVDPQRGADRDTSTDAILGHLDDDTDGGGESDDTADPAVDAGSVGTITISNPNAREQLTDDGILVTFRTGRTPTGRISWEAGHSDDTGGEALIGPLTTTDPSRDRALARYQHRSGFGSVSAWRETIGELPEEGTLYIVVEDSGTSEGGE